MKNILVVLCLTGGFACMAGMASWNILQARYTAERESQKPAVPERLTLEEELRRSSLAAGEEQLATRNRDEAVLMYAGIGGAVGFVSAIALLALTDRRRKLRDLQRATVS